MSAKITIVVTCADRKSLPVAPTLRYRDVPAGTPAERARVWDERLRRGGEKRPLRSLYQGEQWGESLRLAEVAMHVGFEPRIVVASAGLGLLPVSATAPAYAATFTLGKADAVAQTPDQAVAWWAQVARFSSDLELAALDNFVLLVLSRSYALPLAEDLACLGQSGTQSVLVGGASEVDGIVRVPSNAALRPALGGTLSSLNQRMAIRFLELSEGPAGWLSNAHLRRWNAWAEHSQHREVFDRRRLDDDEIRAWIAAIATRGTVSATRALRRLRGEGYACEQGRFGRLFREVVMEP